MRFIETAKLSGLDQTGWCWFQCVLHSLHFIIVNNNFYLFLQDQNVSLCFSRIILLDPHQIHVWNKSKSHCQAWLMDGDNGNLRGYGFPELSLVPGVWVWSPALQVESCVHCRVAYCALFQLTIEIPLIPLASPITSPIFKRSFIIHTWDLCHFWPGQPRLLYSIIINPWIYCFYRKKYCCKHVGKIHRWIRKTTHPDKAWF